jgi:hypothetical protein
VPSLPLLTTDDLDEFGATAFDAGDPLAVAAGLVDAVGQGRVADKANIGYALILAAEITEREEDLDAALVLAERAVEAYRCTGMGSTAPRSFRAGLPVRLAGPTSTCSASGSDHSLNDKCRSPNVPEPDPVFQAASTVCPLRGSLSFA